MNQLVESLKKYGQTYEIHRCKFGILDGYKRQEALVDITKPRIIDHPDIKTVEEYNDWIQAHLPLKLSQKEKKIYAIKRAKEYTTVGFTSGQYIPILGKLLQCSERQIRRYLPDGLKDQLQQERVSGGQMSTENDCERLNGLHPRDDYDWLNKVLWIRVKKEVKNDKNLYDLLDAVKTHFQTLRKIVELDPVEEEKILSRTYEKILNNEELFQELLGRYEEKYPNKRVRIETKGSDTTGE